MRRICRAGNGTVRALAICLIWLGACAASADQAAIARAAEQAWRGWITSVGADVGTLALTYRGKVVQTVGLGTEPGTLVPLASLSKAITAQCVRMLVDEGVLAYDTRVKDHLGGLPGVTVADLLTHRAGLWPDSTQGAMASWRGERASRTGHVARAVLQRDAQQGTPGTFRYNNENYAVLADLIAKATGQPYRMACRKRLPAGLRPDAEFGAFDGWGGWAMAVGDYARLHAALYRDTDPLAAPHAPMGGGAYYGLGMVFRPYQGGFNHWHFGLLCFTDGGFGTFAVQWENGWGAAAYHNRCLDWDTTIKLDTLLSRAVYER